ncbi:MAG: DUF3127 domain-containing protein [Muribaculaceae bacterium]|nr:DUF3127 domain-containing protein [Muribaculaceae bacterium]
MEIEGKVILDLGMTSGTSKAGNAWKKKEIVIETFGTYPRKVKMTLFGDRSETVGADVGQSYSFSVDVESREYMGRWYTDVSAYSSRLLNPPTPGEVYAQPAAPAQAFQQTTVTTSTTTTAPADPFGSSDSDDLPF